ncbi:Major facilitator superfamily domain general substrate transporter [Penicillium soppii]|uniref:Major facilitator superfamily domain general substrate transporter n=1 Tax=Penicillium soppii TaxID=69789 RepID=UPI0025496A1C|nr:Major facilitator superfamily domain general substrate transporter [Penicillium soppii]KAJ5882254.1 Major facilitator superfamily domain general substrate transporter [Penicillium soppii]
MASTIPLLVAIHENLGIVHWNLFIEVDNEADKINIQILGARQRYFPDIKTPSDARIVNSLMEILHLFRIDSRKIGIPENIVYEELTSFPLLYSRLIPDSRAFNLNPGDCTTPCPKNRLIPIIPAMVIFPSGLLLHGWSLQFRYYWIIPTIATILCGSSTTPILNYIVDIFGKRSAFAVAAVLPLRYIAGDFFLSLLPVVPIPLLVIVQPERMKPLTKFLGSY